MSSSTAASAWSALEQEVRELSDGIASPRALPRVTSIERWALDAGSDETPGERSALLCAVSLFHFYVAPEPRHALAPGKAAVHYAELSGDNLRLRSALNVYGIAAADTNDVGMAIRCYERALKLAFDIDDVKAQCAVLNNLGTALTSSAAYRDAIACYRRAAALAERTNDAVLNQFATSVQANMALCYFHLEEPDRAMVAMDSAMKNIAEPRKYPEIVARVLMEYTYTRLLLASGHTARAEEHAADAVFYSGLVQAPRASIAAQNAAALVDVFKGQYESGIRRLTESLAMTQSIKTAYRDTLAALVMASERANRIDLAVSYQKELLNVTRRVAVLNVQFHHELHARRIIRDQPPSDDTVFGLAEDRLERLSEEKNAYDDALEELETLERIAVTTAAREDPTGGHPYRVARLVSLLAERSGLDSATCRTLDLAVRLHDIGNVGVADRVMLSSHRISERERVDVEGHALIGFELLDKYDGPELRMAAAVARAHHERWDGSGYPDRLAGLEIPLVARMTGIAESYDALTHHRSHRAAFDPETALEIVRSEAGSSFDPGLTDVFVDLVRDISASHRSVDEFLESGARASRYLRSRGQIDHLLREPVRN